MNTLRKIIALSLFTTVFSIVSAQTLESVAPSVVQDVSTIDVGTDFIQFEWSAASDEDGIIDDYKIYYGQNSVQTENDVYDSEVQTGNVLSYTLSGLSPSTTYYAAITAFDDEGNESSNYSVEISATTESLSVSDGKNPQVLSAQSVNEGVIEISMSEPIQGADNPAALTIIDFETGQYIDAISVESNENVIIASVNQGSIVEGTTYEISVSSIVTDLEGNPVSSGITDTIQFTAAVINQCETPLDCFLEAVDNKTEASLEVDYTVDYFDTIEQRHKGTLINISEAFGSNAMQLVLDPDLFTEEEVSVGLGSQNVCVYSNPEQFKLFANEIAQGQTSAETLFGTFSQCDVYDADGNFIETTQMGSEGLVLIEELVSLLTNVVDEKEKNPFDTSNPPAENSDPTTTPKEENTPKEEPKETYSSAPDTVAPLDITSFSVDTDSRGEGTVLLSWVVASDIDNDIADQILYTRKNRGELDRGISLGRNIDSYVLDIDSNSDYEIIIVTVDISGNASYGRSIEFSTEELVPSGGSINVVLFGALAVGLIVLVGRRRS